MSDNAVVLFIPDSELTARENLNNFIKMCREELLTFGADLPFDNTVWDLTRYLRTRTRRNAVRIYFTTFDSKKGSDNNPLTKTFGDFTKSYVRYQHSRNSASTLNNKILAFKSIEKAMIELIGSTDPTLITSQVLNYAAKCLKHQYAQATVYSACREIESLSKFVTKKKLVASPLVWKNPIARPSHVTRIGEIFETQRDKKLPSVQALEAIASIFQEATQPSHILVSSICAVMCSAPERISEVLSLPRACEVKQTNSSSGDEKYGLRWYPAKGASPQVKWAASVMSDVLRKAIKNIITVTEPARRIAAWYEENPQKLYLPANLEFLRTKTYLSMDLVSLVVYDIDTPEHNAGSNWCRENKLPTTAEHGRRFILFSDLEKHLLSLLPIDFPVADKKTGLKYSEALFIVQRNLLNQQKRVYRSVITHVDYMNVIRRLSGNTISNIFSCFGFKNKDGSAMSITTHQFRHYLNTLAQSGGMNQIDLAFWSGRKNTMQNDVYDHVSGNDVLALAEKLLPKSNPELAKSKVHTYTLIPRKEWKKLGISSGHTTDYGYCVHDFTMLPCQLHFDCINCDEQICVKGDPAFEKNIRHLYMETKSLLESAEIAAVENQYGSNRWVEHQKVTLERLERLCAILDDPGIEDGAVIKLACNFIETIPLQSKTVAFKTDPRHKINTIFIKSENRPTDE